MPYIPAISLCIYTNINRVHVFITTWRSYKVTTIVQLHTLVLLQINMACNMINEIITLWYECKLNAWMQLKTLCILCSPINLKGITDDVRAVAIRICYVWLCLCLQEVVCLLGTVSIPEDWVSVGKYTFLVLFGLKWYERGWGLVWNTIFGSRIFHSTFYRNKALF